MTTAENPFQLAHGSSGVSANTTTPEKQEDRIQTFKDNLNYVGEKFVEVMTGVPPEKQEDWEKWIDEETYNVDLSNTESERLNKRLKSFISTLLEQVRREERDTLTKLGAIERAKCIYNIHYCKAGVGITFYEPAKDTGDWKSALTTNKYYPTFRECIEAEYASLTHPTKE